VLWTRGAFEELSRAARDDGDFALAVAAAKKVEARGEKPVAEALYKEIAAIYGAGSKRVDPALRPKPPAPPGVARKPHFVPKKLPAVPIAHAVDPVALEKLLVAMRLSERKKGDVILEIGADARSLFLVARGELEVTRASHVLGRLRPESFFGEIALLSGTQRTARVTCVEDTVLLEIDAVALEAAARRSPRLAETLAAHARHRLLGNTMRTSEIFRRLDPAERETLIGRFVPMLWQPDAVVIEDGQEGEHLHVVVSGHLTVERQHVVIAELGPGDVCGEISLLARKPATASVRAQTRSVTLSLDRQSFDDVAMKHPGVLAEVYKLVVVREADQSATSLVVAEEDDLVV
jgi:cAMP-dependent protein kinase regulator